MWFVTRGEILRELRSSTEKSRRRQEVNEFKRRATIIASICLFWRKQNDERLG